MNDETLGKEVKQGRSAEDLLNDPVLTETINYLKDTYLKAWEQTSVENSVEREKIWMMYKTLDTVVGHINSYVDTGKLAKQQLKEMGEQGGLF